MPPKKTKKKPTKLSEIELQEQLLLRDLAKVNFKEYVKQIFSVAEGGEFEDGRHLSFLYKELEEVEKYIRTGGKEGTRFLIVSMPPGHGKSSSCSVAFPTWVMGRSKDTRCAIGSYGATLSLEHSKKALKIMQSKEYSNIFGKNSNLREKVELDPNSQSVDTWRIKDAAGMYIPVGVGGSITGKRAECFPAGTMVMTQDGEIDIADMFENGYDGLIPTYNHVKENIEYKRVTHSLARSTSQVIKITTASGGVVEATPNHKFFTRRGYIRADKLTTSDVVLLCMREKNGETGMRLQEECEEKMQTNILLKKVYGQGIWNKMQNLFSTNRNKEQKILQHMQAQTQVSTRKDESKKSNDVNKVSPVQHIISKICLPSRSCSKILLQNLCRPGSCTENVGEEQSQVQEWSKSSKDTAPCSQGLQEDKAINIEAGRTHVSPMLSNKESDKASCASHRQLARKQQSIKSCDAMRQMSCTLAQGNGLYTREESVARIERVGKTTTVYDIEVEDNHNFFANNILVHNCIIIDDPHKSRKEADSQLMRDDVWKWFTDDLMSRAMKNTAFVILATRWHEDDLIGRLKASNIEYRELMLPAIATDEDDAIGRKVGQPLWPQKFDLPFLMEQKKVGGDRKWNSLYQQSPTSDAGEKVKREWFRYGTFPDREDIVKGIQVWDTAFTEQKENDPSACLTGYLLKNGTFFVADVYTNHLNFVQLKAKVKQKFSQWNDVFPIQTVWIEAQASGKSVMQSLKSEAGHIPIKACNTDKDYGKSKLARFESISSFVENGQVVFQNNASWLVDFEAELLSFPRGKHDDMVDALTYAIISVMDSLSRQTVNSYQLKSQRWKKKHENRAGGSRSRRDRILGGWPW